MQKQDIHYHMDHNNLNENLHKREHKSKAWRWSVLVLALIMLLAACGPVTNLPKEDVKRVMKEAGLELHEYTNEQTDTIMGTSPELNVSWAKTGNADTAKAAAEEFKKSMTEAGMQTDVETGSYSRYSMEMHGMQSIVIRKGDVFVSISGLDKDKVQELIEDLKLEK